MQYKLIFTLTFSIILLTACLNSKNKDVTVSSDATVLSMRFTADEDFPGLAKAKFEVDNGNANDTGRIYNVDSILYGTNVDSVIPIFTFNATPGAAIIYTPHDTTILSVSDTIDFSQKNILLQVVASDNKHEKWYRIQVAVHKVDPDLFAWEQTAQSVYSPEGTEQKAVVLNEHIYLYVNDGVSNTLYRSKEGKVWTKMEITGLPDNCRVRNLTEIYGRVFYAEDEILYVSKDGQVFTPIVLASASYTLKNMLFGFKDSLWAIVQDKATEQIHVATSMDAKNWNLHPALSDDFPISDYAAVTFSSKSRRPRAMILGGFSKNGKSLNSRWNLEYAEERGYTWSNFSISDPNFMQLTGMSVIWYNDRLYLFGGVDENNTIGDYAILESTDEGMSWYKPDSAHNHMPKSYTFRTKPSVVVGEDDAVYVIGGQSRTEVFSDVHRGKLNSIDW